MLALHDDAAIHGRAIALGMSDDFELAIGRLLIDKVREQAPGIRLVFKQTHSLLASDALMNRQFDLALTSGAVASKTLGRLALATGDYTCLTAARADATLLTPGSYESATFWFHRAAMWAWLMSASCAVAESHSGGFNHSFRRASALLQHSDCVATLPTHAAKALASVSNVNATHAQSTFRATQ